MINQWKESAIQSVNESHNYPVTRQRMIDVIKNELITLDLAAAHLSPPPILWELRSLKELNLRSNQLKSLPAAIGQLVNLTLLDLSYNNLTVIPTEIGLLTNLTLLNLEHNVLQVIPTEIGLLTNLQNLDLSYNYDHLNRSNISFSTIPTEIGQLINLTTLCLRNNYKITALPDTIGRLTRLTHLLMKVNELASLPTGIGLLTQLIELDLGSNKLTSLPTEVWSLPRLSKLFLHHNPLRSLPAGIGQLASLTFLCLDHTNITSLPMQLGNVINLQTLIVDHTNISELPLSLGQIPALTHIFMENTPLQRAQRQAILNQSQAMRGQVAVAVLPLRIAKWKAICESVVELDITQLSASQQITLDEWLHRLEFTSDFAKFQTSLARTVCSMLEDVIKNIEFQELFFNQAGANNECCQDRAAMSLNEIYTSWHIVCKSADLSLLTGVAKTLRLRKELQKLIPKNERESVEIFLYYEKALMQRLGLVTAIQSMAFDVIGKRDWIDEKRLIENVEANFFEELFDLSVFEKRVMEACPVEWEAINAEFQEKMGECPEGGPNDSQVLDFQCRQGEILGEWRRKKMDLARQWYNKLI